MKSLSELNLMTDCSPDCYCTVPEMNFFKKMMGYGEDLPTMVKNTKIDNATFYKIIKDARNVILTECQVTFTMNETNEYFIQFQKGEECYEFPIYPEMNLVNFSMNKGGKSNACFEWKLDEENQHIGCYMSPDKQQSFKQVVCRAMKTIANDENIKNHLDFCKELEGIPVYKSTKSSVVSASSKISNPSENLSEVLMKEAGKKENKMVHTASLFQIVNNERTLVNDKVVFALCSLGNFIYEFHVINQTGFCFLKKELTPGLVYEANTDLGYLKWMEIGEPTKIYEVNFEGKRDAAMSLKFDIMECMYEINTKRKLTDAIAEDELAYLRRINEKYDNKSHQNANIVKVYEQKEDIDQIEEKTFVYNNEEAKKGLEKYRTFTQGKTTEISVAALGSMLETLKIDENNEIKHTAHHRLFDRQNAEVKSSVLLFHDNDSKIAAVGEDGKLYYHDMNKQMLISQYEIDKKHGLIDILPETKHSKGYANFKGISSNSIFEIDPRLEKGVENHKRYSTDPEFNTMSVDHKGNFAVGSETGEIRLYNKIGSNANCKYSSFGDKVLHLDSTKDGKWLLATFSQFLILLPTETEAEDSHYQRKVPFKERLDPIKLSIKLQHLQMCKCNNLQFIPAKFDESEGREKYIVGGFGEYVVIWNLSQVIKGETQNYKFSKTNGELLQVDFKYNDIRKLIMVGQQGIKVKENRVRNA